MGWLICWLVGWLAGWLVGWFDCLWGSGRVGRMGGGESSFQRDIGLGKGAYEVYLTPYTICGQIRNWLFSRHWAFICCFIVLWLYISQAFTNGFDIYCTYTSPVHRRFRHGSAAWGVERVQGTRGQHHTLFITQNTNIKS